MFLGKQLKFTYPFVYDFFLPDEFLSENPDLSDVLQKKDAITKEPYKSLENISSLAGVEFTSFAKNSAFDAGEFLSSDLSHLTRLPCVSQFPSEKKISSCNLYFHIIVVL
jgi:hypothetical protein